MKKNHDRNHINCPNRYRSICISYYFLNVQSINLKFDTCHRLLFKSTFGTLHSRNINFRIHLPLVIDLDTIIVTVEYIRKYAVPFKKPSYSHCCSSTIWSRTDYKLLRITVVFLKLLTQLLIGLFSVF